MCIISWKIYLRYCWILKYTGKDLVTRLKDQAKQFNPDIYLNEKVEKLEKLVDGTFKLTTNNGTHLTKTIILSAGIGAFEPRKLDIQDSEKYEKTNLHYFINDMNYFKDKKY